MDIQRVLPLAEQVKSGLRKKILNGEFKRGERLPSEEKLSIDLGVSRTTIRSALASLAAEGVIIRKQGDGTFVNYRAIGVPHRLESHWQFEEYISASGKTPKMEIIEEMIRYPNEYESEILEIDSDHEVLVVRRLFFADDSPAILATDVLPCSSLGSNYSPNALTKPILEFLESYCGKTHIYNIAEVSVRLADDLVAQFMNFKRGDPILYLEEVFYDGNDTPIMIAQNYHDGNILKLKLVRGRSQ